MKIIALGPKGSYGHEAALIARKNLRLEDDIPICFVPTNVSILKTAEPEGSIAVIPVENSTYGDVVDVLGYLATKSAKYPLRIIGQIELSVRHCLMVRQEISSVKEIETVLSHPQALGQCGESVTNWKCKTEATTSTAAAAKYVAGHPEMKIGAIASELAAQEYELKILARDVQTLADNTTRFFLFGPERTSQPTGDDKTVIIFKVPNEPTMLLEALSPFATRNINMTAIHSVALGGWKYGFYAEIEGHMRNLPVQEALRELTSKTVEQWVLGSFPK